MATQILYKTCGYGLVNGWYMKMPKKATEARAEWVYINLPREIGEKIDCCRI